MVAGLLVFGRGHSMMLMKIAARMFVAVGCLATVISCDTQPPAPPSSPAQEVARVPVPGGAGSRGMPGVMSISPDGTRVALPARITSGGGGGGGGGSDGGDGASARSAQTAAVDSVAIYNAATKQF